jgi:putative ABC transport system permease protein
MKSMRLIETLWQDLRYAARSLRRQPGFTAVAVLTLALGIGLNTAIYTLVDATMLRSLPFREPGRLMRISQVIPAMPGSPMANNIVEDMVWSYPRYEVFRKLQQSFEDLAVYRPTTFNLTNTDRPEHLRGELVSASYFSLLGIRAKVGRTFLPDEDVVPDSNFVVLISHSLWVDHYGGDGAIRGKSVRLNQRSYTVVGVLPAGFQGLSGPADVWVPVHTLPAQELSEPFSYSWQQLGRLKEGVSVKQAKSEVTVLGPRIDGAMPNAPAPFMKGWGAKARTFDESRLDPVIRTAVLVLFGAVTFVLLIACVNLANLLLARGRTLLRDIAIRSALGATRSRIVRYLLTESLLLAVLGAGAGVALAYVGLFGLHLIDPDVLAFGRRLPGLTVLGLSSTRFDSRAVLFTLSMALVTGILFGLVPALQGARASTIDALKRVGDRQVGWTGIRWFAARNLLVVGEIALAMVLLAGAGLMIKSFGRLMATRTGVNPENVLTARITFLGIGAGAFFDQLAQRVAALPGIVSAGLSDCHALAGSCNGTTVTFPDRPDVSPGTEPGIGLHWASPEYFRTMQIPLIRGRWFSKSEPADSPKVVVVNETSARRYWPGEDPIGKRIGLGIDGWQRAEVIGVVGDVLYGRMDQQPQPDAYVSYLQSPPDDMLLFLRTASDPTAFANAVRREVRALNKDLPVYDIKTMQQRIGDATARARFSAILLAAFAAIAFVLAGIGIYGVVSYVVRQRTHEIGIRMALGARVEDVQGMVVRRAVALATAGIAIGLVGALTATHVLGTLLYEVKPSDPETYLVISALLGGLAVLASYLPARRASKIDPCEALRTE